MGRGTLAAVLIGALLSGCTITTRSESQDQGPSNACSSDADCSDGSCSQDVCQTLNGQLESLLLEVTPTSDSDLPHIPFLAHLEDLPTSGGALALDLTRSVHIKGRLHPQDVPGCVRTFYGPQGKALSPATDGESMPITATLIPRETVLGLQAQVYLADATLPTINESSGVEYTFDLQVPAGSYDVYIEPGRHDIAPVDADSVVDESCRVPPQLFRTASIVESIDVTYQPHATTQLVVRVLFPESAGMLEGWVVDIIDRLSGRPISNERTLTEPQVVSPNATRKLLEYTAPVAYSGIEPSDTTEAAVEGATDLIRLRPPAGLVAPTVFLDRSGLGLFSTDSVAIEDFTQFPQAVAVQGQMTALADGQPARGRVSLVSTEIFGVDAGIFAAFQSVVEVDDSGLFNVLLPPGKYRVYAVPPLLDDTVRRLSAHETSWEIPADVSFQAGKLLELPSLTEVVGQTSLLGADVRVVPSPQTILPFEQAFGAAAFIPRATAGLVDDAGRFVIEADPGRFDIAVRPPDSSRYAWSVRPGFQVEAGALKQELGRLAPRSPSVVEGVAKVGDVKVTSALIRAYAYLDASLTYTGDLREARSVIQVAETRTDEEGGFRLFIPDSIAASR